MAWLSKLELGRKTKKGEALQGHAVTLSGKRRHRPGGVPETCILLEDEKEATSGDEVGP